MEASHSRKNERGKITLNRSMLFKGSGPKSIGFQGFKIVNSKIKVVKQVEVKNPHSKSKQVTDMVSPKKPTNQSNVSTGQTDGRLTSRPICNEKKGIGGGDDASSTTQSNVSTLKEIRERIQAKKKNQERCSDESEKFSHIQNGTHSDSSPTSKIDKQQKYSPPKHSEATDKPKPEKSHNHDLINDKKLGPNFTDDSAKPRKKHHNEQDRRGDLQLSPYHRDKSESTLSDDKRKSVKTSSKSRHGEDERVRSDGYHKRHDRHSDNHRRSKRSSDNHDSYEGNSNAGAGYSTSSNDKSYNHDDYREKRDYDKDEYHSKQSHQKYSSRKHRERSKSPYWEKEHRHHGRNRYGSEKKIYPPDRSTSPYRDEDKDAYFSKSLVSDRDNFYHDKEYSNTSSHSRSNHKHRTYGRKYSASRDGRDTNHEPSHARKSDSRNDGRNNHFHPDSQRDGRSSKSQRRNNDKDIVQQKPSGRDTSEYKDSHTKYERNHEQKIHTSPPPPPKNNSVGGIDKKGQATEKNKRTKIDEGLFSKLSIAFSLDGEDEDYEVEISGSDHDSRKEEGDSHEEEGNISESDSESFHDRAISSNCEQTNENAKTFYHEDSTGEDVAPMMVVDEVKTDSSECDMFDDRSDSISNSIYKSDLDQHSNNDPNGECHGDNTVSEDVVVRGLNRKSIETTSSIPCTEGSHDNEPEWNSVDKDLDYSISSPPTPLMDEPQDNVILMNRTISEQQVTADVIPTTASAFGYSKTQSACSNKEVSVKSSADLSTFNDSSSLPANSMTDGVDSVKNVTQSLHQAGSDETSTNPTENIENMQSNNICTQSDPSSDFMKQNNVPVPSSAALNSSDQVTAMQTLFMASTTTCASPEVTASESQKTESVTCITTSINSQPVRTSSLSGQNKIPHITSQLESVYKSLLNTNFQANDADKSLESLTARILQEKKPCNVTRSGCESTLSDPRLVRSSNSLTPIIKQECLESKEDRELEKDCKPHVEPLQDVASVEFEVEKVLVEAVTSVSSCSQQDMSVTMLPHKLKLHATTKTPLPAKKSYIQQVHPQVKSQESNNTPHTSFNQTVTILPPNQQHTSYLAGDDESDTSNQVQDKTSCLVEDSHIETSLSRQDSNSSGANDNDEGPRRSARIRTKKSERSLKKQTSMDVNQGQPDGVASSTDISIDNVEPVSDVPKPPDRNIFECSLKELTEEEIFKVKICLTPGVADCPERFHLLEENIYLTSVKKSRARKEIKRMVCDCGLDDSNESEDPCGENCLNRLLMIECSSRCLYGSKCTNKRFQTRKYAPTEVFKTDFKGWGIRAAEDMEPGELVMEYCGEVVDQREFTRRSLEYSKSNHTHFYFMALCQDEVIDATYKGNASRFINHSCDPNAETQKWTVNGRLRVGFFTVKPIKKGEEITFDYQFERYGKIAQKCYCGAAKCRGYLGKAPDENDESETKFSKLLSSEAFWENDDSAEKTQKKKKMSIFQDDMMEKDISRLKNGLQSTKDVLTLSRLMVRCDTHTQRSMCLQVLKDTTCQTRLKTFLRFHGLSIIWSWMVDISSADNGEAASLKMDIINTLCILPISNKNVIEDSKVLPVVQRWAKPDLDEKSDVGDEKPDEVVAEKDNGDGPEVNDGGTTSETSLVDTAAIDNTVSCEDVSPKADEDVIPSTTPSPNDEPTEQNENISSEKLIEAAAKLLDSWKDLKEIYRIPKRQRPIPSPSQDSSSRASSPAPKQYKTEDYDVKLPRSVNAWRDNSLERWKDFSERSMEGKYKDIQASPSSNTSSENRREPTRRKRRFSTDSDDGSVPWHCKPPRSLKMSREEHRRRFEQGVEKREQEKRRLEEMEAEMTRNSMINHQHSYMVEEIPPLVGADVAMMAPGTTFTPGGVSGNLIQINPAPVMVNQFGQQVDMLQPMMQQNMYDAQMSVQQGYTVQQNMQGIYSTDVAVQQGYQDGYSFQAANPQPGISMTGMNQQQMLGNSFSVANPQTVPMQHMAQQPLTTVPPPQQPMNNVTILGTQNGQAIVMLSAEQLQKLTQGDLSSVTSKADNAKKTEENTKDSIDANTAPKQLPPNWKTATDPDGRVYYYHDITRETQWDPPKWKDVASEKADKASPSDDDKQSKDKKKQDKATDEGRKAKDQFRLKMSQFVVQCLSSFRKPDRKLGRITSTEDFKHLARKLTHIIMQKELRQVQVLEDLDFNANVKHKTKEYVKKYMSKVGPVYRIKDDT